MKIRCNIGTGGRIIRIVTGIILIADAVLLYRFGFPGNGFFSRFLQAVLLLMGAFAIFEGAAGWCMIRAMGKKTRF